MFIEDGVTRREKALFQVRALKRERFDKFVCPDEAGTNLKKGALPFLSSTAIAGGKGEAPMFIQANGGAFTMRHLRRFVLVVGLRQFRGPEALKRYMKKLSLPLLLCVSLLVAVPALADQFTIGSPADAGTGNCYPFGCAYNSEYLQVYGGSSFSGPVTITSLEFFNTQYNSGATAMNSGTFTITLSTTTDDSPSGLDSCFSCAIGSDNTTVFHGSLAQPWAFGDTLVINLATPFTYNPADGNLLMNVTVSGASDAGGIIYFDTSGASYFGAQTDVSTENPTMGTVCCYSGGEGFTTAGGGLVTGFTTTGTTVPEASSSLLLGAGLLGLLALAARSKRRTLSASC